MITSWDQLDARLAVDGPLPLIAIRPQRFRSSPLLASEEEPTGLLNHPAVRQEVAALARSLRGESPRPPVLEALIMEEAPQTVGSIAAVTALDVEAVDETVQQLTAAGLVQPTIEDGVERVALTIPSEQ